MENLASISIRIVGVVSIGLAIAGYWYTYAYYQAMSMEPYDPEIPHFKEAYLVMIVVCLLFYTALAAFGAQFLMMIINYKNLFYVLLVAEILYFLSLGFLWRLENQELAMSIGAATGVANGGLVFQAVTGFIIWAPLVMQWASKRVLQ
ncbi:MAG: hypothetical protein AB2826_23170 [Candidatus Thiodiazotropha sp.]